MGKEFSKWLLDNKRELQTINKIYIYGAGKWGRRVFCHFIHNKIQVNGFIVSDISTVGEINRQDNNKGKYVEQLSAIKYYSYDYIKDNLLDAYIIIAIDGNAGTQIERKLRKDGITKCYHVEKLDTFFANKKDLKDEEYFEYLPLWYWDIMNVIPDLDNPMTFTEKIQWLKSKGVTPVMSKLADKYEVRTWIEEKIGTQYLIPILGVWDSCEGIDFNNLPNKFVLKCNHGSGMNIVIRDRDLLDVNQTVSMLSKWLSEDFSLRTLEMQYKFINRKIIAEQYIEELSGNLYDYKFHCFEGTPKFIECIGDRNISTHEGFQRNYDLDWNELQWTFEDYPRFNHKVDRPENLEEMIQIARTLSQGFPYVRVDLYDLGTKVYFGEMTFTPASGVGVYKGSWSKIKDKELGKYIISI